MKKKNKKTKSIKHSHILRIYSVSFFTITALAVSVCLLLNHSSNSRQKKTLAATTLPDPLFTANSPWNQPIGTNIQLDPNSAAMVSAVDSRVNPTTAAFGMPLYFGTASDPTCTLKASSGDEPFDSDQPIHIPSNATPSTGDDHWLFVYDTTKNLIFEMWDTAKSGSCFTLNTGNVYSPTGDGVLQPNGQTQDGNGGSYFGGVVNQNDAVRGSINHALSLASQATLKNAGRYPMNAQTDGGNGVVPMGARFQLDPSVNCDGLSGASKGEIMICHAMQIYGGYMHDTGGVPMSIYFQEDGTTGGAWTAAGLNENNALTHIPWNQMRVLKAWNSYTPLTGTPTVTTAITPGATSPVGSPTVTSSTASVTPAASSTPSVTPTPSITPTPTPLPNTTINLQLALPGIGINGGNTHPLHPLRGISFYLYGVDSGTLVTQTNSVVFDGSYFSRPVINLGQIPNGNYQIFIHSPGYLTMRLSQGTSSIIAIQNGQPIQVTPNTLIPGDIAPQHGTTYGDNILDILDYNTLYSCYGNRANQATCINKQAADLDDNGIVDAVDYNILLRGISVAHTGDTIPGSPNL